MMTSNFHIPNEHFRRVVTSMELCELFLHHPPCQHIIKIDSFHNISIQGKSPKSLALVLSRLDLAQLNNIFIALKLLSAVAVLTEMV